MYKIFISQHFKSQLKPLAKKDRDLKELVQNTLKDFDKKMAIPVGSGMFKLRLRRSGGGKSGGYRLYVFVMEIEGILTPICIYSKGDRENVGKNELAKHVEGVKGELEELL